MASIWRTIFSKIRAWTTDQKSSLKPTYQALGTILERLFKITQGFEAENPSNLRCLHCEERRTEVKQTKLRWSSIQLKALKMWTEDVKVTEIRINVKYKDLRSFRGTFLIFEFLWQEPKNQIGLPACPCWFSSQTIYIFGKSIKNGICTPFCGARHGNSITLVDAWTCSLW